AHLAAVKLLAVPAVGLGLAAAAGLAGDQRAVVLAFAALPSATSAYVLTARMGGDGALVAAQTSLTTAAALVTLPVWLALAV
ncbi:MAG: AEC family transporter, partial [Actinomycetota bacterium]|nr:AEC family transporter [Actinomycetota bacterium]